MKSKKLTASLSYARKAKRINLNVVGFITFIGTFLIVSSVTQANDLQIYAAPTVGKKTLVMMLDTSGSMGPASGSGFSYKDDYGLNCGIAYTSTSLATLITSLSNLYSNTAYRISSGTVPSYERNFCYVSSGSATATVKDEVSGCDPIKNSSGTITGYQCLDRLTRLKDGMFAFLNSEDASLRQVRVGLGNYSANGDGHSGQILVPAKELGSLNSPQRIALKNAISSLVAYNGTPTAHAYAEAAAYLMGTSTLQWVNLNNAPVYFKFNNNYYKACASWNNTKTSCNAWSGWINRQLSSSAVSGMNSWGCSLDGYSGTCYRKTGNHLVDVDSGFSHSSDSTKVANKTTYQSPLPAVTDRQSCDGQGIYILSDGAANSTDDTRSSNIMSTALATFGGNFSCDGGLSEGFDGTNPGGWRCMGEFAKRLFNPEQNPSGVSIQTAFVGFGDTMNNLGKGYVENACRLSSRTQDDRKSDDQCSPTAPGYRTPKPGYGNGGFFIAKESSEITHSVIQFIDNLSNHQIAPLSTGAVSVPVDALSPQSFQSYGYLRVLEPKPGTQNITWTGNLKKYNIQGGAQKGKDGTGFVFKNNGLLSPNSRDFWGSTSGVGVIEGGVYSKLKLPTIVSPNGHRPLYSDIQSVASSGEITPTGKKSDLFLVTQSAITASALLDKFKTDTRLKNLALNIQLKLLNYLGYDLSLSLTQLPNSLNPPKDAFTSMGASIHSFPVQITYEGKLDALGNLKDARKQSVLYGSMEGALRIVDSNTGQEQMVFVPADILQNPTASKALRKGESDIQGVVHGISGAWVADTAYQVKAGSRSEPETSVVANKMNVYGGMRMGGKSYYGLDVINPSSPKLLFHILGGTGDYIRMGQTWSKPVLANIRYNNQIIRVMIVGGGYDMCYENPRFRLNALNSNTDYPSISCDNKTQADGNAIYMIDAKTGERIWWASNANANTNNTNMTHSVVSRISTLDRDGDGLVDHLFFGDLGGQVFRVDLNNAKNTPPASFGKRVVRLANLATKADGTAITNGDQPRFYQPPTLTVHDEGTSTFVMVGIASGDRSTPLDVSPNKGRELMLPLNELTGRPTNKVYGLIDRDIADSGLITGTKDPITGVYKDITLKSVDITLKYLKANPQKIEGVISQTFFPYTKESMQGWYRSLSSDQNGNPVAGRTAGGVKAFEEEPVAMTGRLIIPVYDPEGTGIVDRQNPCQPRIIGESNSQQFCLPYGACLDAKGVVDWNLEKSTGFQISDGKNQNVLGPGIQGITFGPDDTNSGGNSSGNTCGALTLLGLQQGKGRWECNKILNPIRWYEKYVEAKYN